MRFVVAALCAVTVVHAQRPIGIDLDGTAVVMDVATGRVVAAHRLDLATGTLVRPGSTIKPFILESLKEHGAAGRRLMCPQTLRIGTKRLDCTHIPLNEPVDAHRAIAYSCNNWFAESSRGVSGADLRQTLLRFGFGSVELPRDDDAKRLLALGEAGVRVTPLELLGAYRKLALRGGDADLAAAAEFGTARLAEPFGVEIAAKTGTTSDGAFLAGWIPAQHPRYVLVVYLKGGSGGSDAAPVARQIFASLAPKDPHGVRVQQNGRVADVPFEEYVAGVVAGEAGVMRSAESLKAMAVTARTWAAALRGRHHAEGFDFCSTTHCQNYRPAVLSATAVEAVQATAGEMLWFGGRPAFTYYSGDCGGVSEAGKAVWPGLDVPYLRQQNDPWCGSRGLKEWRAELEKTAVVQALRDEGIGMLAGGGPVRVLSRTPSGRVERIALGSAEVAGPAFRFAVGRRMGWNLIRSDAFEISDQGTTMVLRGTGAGHGAGLCQAGAAHMGEQGRGYREILAFYYPGTTLSRTAKGIEWTTLSGERVRLVTSRVDQDRAVLKAAELAASQLEQRTGLHFRKPPEVRVYPNVAAFRDATGEPGWIAASTRGDVIRLQPGVGAEILKHELLHALIEQNAVAGLPVWFREGLVLNLVPDRERSARSAGEIGRAQSRAEFATAYEGARLRVKRLIDAHGERTVLGWVSSGVPREVDGPGKPTR